MERNPHLVLEGVAIACYAIGAKTGYIYIRGEFCHVAARPRGRHRRGARAGLPREEHLRQRRSTARSTCTAAPARTRRGEESALLESLEGKRAQPAAAAAVPGGGRPLRLPDDHQQRRDARQRPAHHRERRGVVRRARPGEERRAEALLRQRPREQARRLRGVDGHDAAAADLRLRGRHPRRPPAQGGHSGRVVDAGPAAVGDRRAGQLRRRRQGGIDARLRGHDRDGRHHLHGVGRREPDPLLPPRVVREVHARAARAPTGC